MNLCGRDAGVAWRSGDGSWRGVMAGPVGCWLDGSALVLLWIGWIAYSFGSGDLSQAAPCAPFLWCAEGGFAVLPVDQAR